MGEKEKERPLDRSNRSKARKVANRIVSDFERGTFYFGLVLVAFLAWAFWWAL